MHLLLLSRLSKTPEASSSNDQRRAREELLDSCHGGALGPLIQEAKLTTSDGAPVTIYFASFLVYLASLFQMGGSFHDLLQRKHQSNPSSVHRPWNLILYSDEVVPGNVLGRAERKFWAVYGTFHELRQFIHHEDIWLTMSLERSNFVSQLQGGVCQIMSTVLKAIFCDAHVEPRAGYLLKSPCGPDIRLHFQWGICLADGAAHKAIWSSKGDAGTKYCFLCANVHSRPAASPEDQDVIDHYTKYNQLKLYQRLDEKKRTATTKAEFNFWQQATGWTWNAHALLLHQPLLSKGQIRPVSQFCHDWMHGILQGTAPAVLFHTMQTIGGGGFDAWYSMHRYVQLWSLAGAWKGGHLTCFPPRW